MDWYEEKLEPTDTLENDGEDWALEDTDLPDADMAEDFPCSADEVEIVVINGKKEDYSFRNTAESKRGGGKQATIYSCTGRVSQKEFAIKFYKPDMINYEALLRVWKCLEINKHPNVTNVIEFGKCNVFEKDYYYVVMDSYEPLNRKEYIWNGTDSPEYRERILSFVEDMNAALKYLHIGHKIFHSDIKPSNIMVNPKTGENVLIDFGGAGQAKNHQDTGVVAIATTARYAAPETTRRGYHENEFSEYYRVGVSLAELMDGTYPGNIREVESRFGQVKDINMYRIPSDLPEYYENLIRGLVFENSNDELLKEHRWNSGKVDMWLRDMKSGRLKNAAEVNRVPAAVFSDAARNEASWDFGNVISLEVGQEEETYRFRNLVELADTFLDANPQKNIWEDAIGALLNTRAFSDNNVRTDVLEVIQRGIRRMQDVDPRRGQSLNAEFFKFLYKYVSDKQKFRWKDLPEVTTLEEFGVSLYAVLERIQEQNGFFDEWWKNMQESKRAKSTAFAEIFSNHVFSFYIKRAASEDEALLEQAKKVEAIFANRKERYTAEDLTEMFLLARMILKDTSYELLPGVVFDSFEEFRQSVARMAQDAQRLDELQQYMAAAKNENGYYPSFLAWKMMKRV